MVQTRVVAYDEDISVIGGFQMNGGHRVYTNTIQLIDTKTELVEILTHMVYPASGVAPILVNDILYIFGGFHGDKA